MRTTSVHAGVRGCRRDAGDRRRGVRRRRRRVEPTGSAPAAPNEELTGTIRIDGSSTVFPFAEAAGELFNEEQPNVQVTVGASGTGGGFEKFCAGETDVSTASRPIKDDEEAPVCEKAGIKYEEVQIANDGIAVVTNKDLAVDCLTVDQLKAIWEPGSKVVEPQRGRRRPPGLAAQALRPRHGLRHVRLLHRRRSTARRARRARTTRPPRTTTSS